MFVTELRHLPGSSKCLCLSFQCINFLQRKQGWPIFLLKIHDLLQERRALLNRRVLPEADGRPAEPAHPRQPDAGRARD